MGILEGGPYGPVTGKIGNNVQYMLNGKNVIRMCGKITKAPTVKQLADRQRMRVVNQFLRHVQSAINIGFKFVVEGTDKNPYNQAVSYHKKNAIIGEYPDQVLDYTKVKLSVGELDSPVNPSLKKLPEGIEFKWDTPEIDSNARKRDRAMLMIYYPDNGNGLFFNGAIRSAGRDLIELPANMIDKNIEAYIYFFAWDGSAVSDSVYIPQES